MRTLAAVGALWLTASAVAAWSFARARRHASQAECQRRHPATRAKAEADILALADAVGVLREPLVRELACTPAIRAMSTSESTEWLATAREIESLPVYRGGR